MLKNTTKTFSPPPPVPPRPPPPSIPLAFDERQKMYGGLLRADPSVARRTLPMLPHASKAQDMAAAVMLLIDTTGCDMLEEEAGGGSRRNEREAEVAVRHVK